MKRIIIGYIAKSNFALEIGKALPEPKIRDTEVFNLNKLNYRNDREPEAWQGKGNRKKPRVK
ncbi:hypothetical protein [Acinetobacter colistiniresistens]|uniref:hypothetical protein n=1 Tax=Acinetobacter colistiniresistens TaxID=280145 RepID=UPI00124FAC1D|nr:hypothetical protein [Acinetobacter colistiniresistens]